MKSLQLLINEAQQDQIDLLRCNLPQSLLLTGQRGIGLATMAAFIATDAHYLTIHPGLLTKASTIEQISIDQIRTLYDQTRTKSDTPRVIIIDDADRMTMAAQNSFLKLLEEPVKNVYFILTSHQPGHLLPTIRSRLQSVHLRPISPSQTQALLDKHACKSTKRDQIIYIASGLPAEITRLATDEIYFAGLSEETQLAKQLIESSSYRRLSLLQHQKLSRSEATELLTRVVSLLERYPSRESIAMLERCLEALDTIKTGGNIRLQLASAMI